jgi:hypothetical protein
VIATVTRKPPLSPEERKAVTDLYGKALESFDRTMVTVTGGALVLSTTFFRNVTPNPVPSSATWLWIGWGALVGSLVIVVLSMLTGHLAIEADLAERETKWGAVTSALNFLSVVALVIGLSGLVWFAKANAFNPPPQPIQNCPPAGSS